MARRRALAGVLLAAALGLACAGMTPAALEGRRAYQQALTELASDRMRGIAALDAFLTRNPTSLYADDASLRLAELALEDGNTVAAERRLRWAVENLPRADKTDAIRLELARLQLERGEAEIAAETVQPLRLSLLGSERRRKAHALNAEIARARGDAAAELRWLGRVRADQTDPNRAADVEARMDEILAELSGEELEGAARELGRRLPAGRIWLARAERAVSAGQTSIAVGALGRAGALPLTRGEAGRLAALKSRISATSVEQSQLPSWEGREGRASIDIEGARATIGVAVPLSGPYARFGEETLQGVLLAAGAFDPERKGASGVRVVVRDTAGDPDQAARVVGELADEPDLIAIIGPLRGPCAEAAAPVAEDREVPLLTLTRRESVPGLGRFVMRLGATPRLEAELLADYAITELGLRRFAILYPDVEYGRELRAAFWDAVEGRGGEIVGVGRYADNATDFAAPIRRLIGFEFLNGAQRGALAERAKLVKRAKRLPPEAAQELRDEAAEMKASDGSPLPPFIDFDALFIPDTHENAGLIAPHLAFHEVTGVRLLGTAGWSHPDLLELGGSHVNGAIFASPFYAESTVPFVAEFVRRFERSFGRPPTDLAAQSFDAAHLVLLQVARGAGAREAVLAGLLGVRQVVGASGVISLGPDGTAWKRPSLLGVERGRIVSVDETGTAPYLRTREPEPPADGGPST